MLAVAVSAREKLWQVVKLLLGAWVLLREPRVQSFASKDVLVAWFGWVQRAGSRTLTGTGLKGSIAIRLLGLVALGSLWRRAGACQTVSQLC